MWMSSRPRPFPAFASYAALFYITHIEASKLGLSRHDPRKELPPFFKTLVSRRCTTCIPLLFLLYQLIIARHSPELAAAFQAASVVMARPSC